MTGRDPEGKEPSSVTFQIRPLVFQWTQMQCFGERVKGNERQCDAVGSAAQTPWSEFMAAVCLQKTFFWVKF